MFTEANESNVCYMCACVSANRQFCITQRTKTTFSVVVRINKTTTLAAIASLPAVVGIIVVGDIVVGGVVVGAFGSSVSLQLPSVGTWQAAHSSLLANC